MGIRGTVEERFMAKVNKTDDHWLWTASTVGGYGQFWFEGKTRRAHVVSYLLFVGPIPEGFEIAHICHTPPCVRPDHLEATSHVGNLAMSKSNICKRGHNKLEVGTRENGRCAQCYRDYMRWYYHNAYKPESEREPLP